jgi:hypothetical protein
MVQNDYDKWHLLCIVSFEFEYMFNVCQIYFEERISKQSRIDGRKIKTHSSVFKNYRGNFQ